MKNVRLFIDGRDVYVRLREFMDRLPSGYPTTESGVELRVLRKLYTPEEAEMFMKLRFFPEPVRVIAKRLGEPEDELEKKLEAMVEKGLLLRMRGGDMTFYQASQFAFGVYEVTFMKWGDQELAELLEEYDLSLESRLDQLRLVPVQANVDNTPAVSDYDQIRDIVKNHELIGLSQCFCNKKNGLLGKRCEHDFDRCMTFDTVAEYFIELGTARRIGAGEALELLDRAEREGLVMQPMNSRNPLLLCLCCSCCCEMLRMIKTYDQPARHVNSSYHAAVDPDLCISCGSCFERCPMNALGEDKTVQVDLGRCIGCGVCVTACEEGAIRMVHKGVVRTIPNDFFDMLSTLAKKRETGFGHLDWAMKKTTIPMMLKALPFMYKAHLAQPAANFLARRGWI